MLSDAIISSNILTERHSQEDLQRSLNILFHQNLSVDVLVGVYKPRQIKRKQNVTCIDPLNKIEENLESAYSDARYLCEQHYINSPNIVIDRNTFNDRVFPYNPDHTYLIFFEIFKNSLRATMEAASEEDENLPTVDVGITADASGLVTVSISDQGSGMSPDRLKQAQQFFSTSAVLDGMSLYQGAHSSPLAGFGFGLGMARIYAEYFSGNLNIESVAGLGTRVQISLQSNANSARENLFY